MYNYKTIKSITFYDTSYILYQTLHKIKKKKKPEEGLWGSVGQFSFISGISKSGMLLIKGHFWAQRSGKIDHT